MDKDIKKIAVIILNWNGAELLQRFLPSVVACSPKELSEIIVADNGSTDHSLQLLAEKFPDVSVIRFDENYGFAKGYNLAIGQIKNPYCVLLNSDVEVTEGWLDAPLALLEENANIAAVQPKILSARTRNMFEYAGACGGFIDKYGYPFCRGRLFSVVEKDTGQYDEPIDILWASGACLFIKTEIYNKIGGLDSDFFAHQEEVDMCWRLRSRGYRIVFTPFSKIYHLGGGTLNAESPRKTFLNFRNNLLMLYKNLPDKELSRVMLIRRFLDYAAAIKFLMEGHWENAKAVYRARQEFYLLQHKYLPARLINLKSSKTEEIPERKSFSLLWQFYVQGQKHYDELPQ